MCVENCLLGFIAKDKSVFNYDEKISLWVPRALNIPYWGMKVDENGRSTKAVAMVAICLKLFII